MLRSVGAVLGGTLGMFAVVIAGGPVLGRAGGARAAALHDA